MAVNRVDYAGQTLIDLTGDTVDESTLAKGATAHDKSGKLIYGTMESGGSAGNFGPFKNVVIREFTPSDVEPIISLEQDDMQRLEYVIVINPTDKHADHANKVLYSFCASKDSAAFFISNKGKVQKARATLDTSSKTITVNNGEFISGQKYYLVFLYR